MLVLIFVILIWIWSNIDQYCKYLCWNRYLQYWPVLYLILIWYHQYRKYWHWNQYLWFWPVSDLILIRYWSISQISILVSIFVVLISIRAGTDPIPINIANIDAGIDIFNIDQCWIWSDTINIAKSILESILTVWSISKSINIGVDICYIDRIVYLSDQYRKYRYWNHYFWYWLVSDQYKNAQSHLFATTTLTCAVVLLHARTGLTIFHLQTVRLHLWDVFVLSFICTQKS